MRFKKIAAFIGGALMIGMTAGVATAASFPAPFVASGSNGVGLVYGTGLDVSSTDQSAATSIRAALAEEMPSAGGTTTIDGDSFLFEKTTSKLWLGKGVLDVVPTSLDNDELSDVLAKGTYIDDDNDEFEFKQKIDMANLTLTLFDENDYERDTPTVGFKVDGGEILNYTLDFSSTPYWSDLTNTELTLLGKTYYVLSTSGNNTLNLLDSADSILLNEGESKSVNGKDVSIAFIGKDQVKLTVDGVTTNTLATGETQKLSDGSYLGVKDILVQDYADGVKQVEFSIGTGKLVLANGSTVEMNGEDVKGITTTITNSGTSGTDKLDQVTIHWKSDEKTFITETSEAVMPGFEAVKLVYTGMSYPTEEEFVLEADGDDSLVLSGFKTKKDSSDIHLLYSNGTNFTGLGFDSDNKLATAYKGENLTFIKGTHDYFVLSYKSGDVAESYIVKAASFDDGANNTAGDDDDTVKIEYKVDGSWVEEDAAAELGDIIEIGSASFKIEDVDDSTDTLIVSARTGSSFNMLYSDEGLEVFLPWINTTDVTFVNGTNYSSTTACAGAIAAGNITSINTSIGQLGYDHSLTYQINESANGTTTCQDLPATYTLLMKEENKDATIGGGNPFNFSIGLATSDARVSVNAVNGATGGYEVGQSTKEYLYYVNGALATEILYNSGGDQDYATVKYHGGESYGSLSIAESSATTSGSSATGGILYKDTEVELYKNKDLIIVGGSCINSAAAAALGVSDHTCGTAFTTATGVSAGQFLIETVVNPNNADKIAVVVAGYDAADTTNAATYLRTQTVDTSVGKKYVGTSATQADLLVE